MQRLACAPRPDWKQTIESQGLVFHSNDDGACYWSEGAFYQFTAREIEALETATSVLNTMCLEAIEYSIAQNKWDDFGIPVPLRRWIRNSWETEEHTIYGRFDLAFDGTTIKLLEYNADTPTGLLEAAVVQWFWFRDIFAHVDGTDQFNAIHERLIEAWKRIKSEVSPEVAFAGIDDGGEDFITVSYLRDTAMQAGLKTQFLPMHDIVWNKARNVFADKSGRELGCVFKLYPWEWMADEKFGAMLPQSSTGKHTRWLEAPWKMLLSNKMLLRVLYELFPNSPYILRCETQSWDGDYVRKPLLSREGANTQIVLNGQTLQQTSGPYDKGNFVFQEYIELPQFDDFFPIVGSWMVNGYPCGIGIREDSSRITTNLSRFTPHIFRT
ncbi:MAG TPA: glutathionylspermidine synthase family protein [Abditibacteriaceae bacterium]|nr:glutathionylspermidine synthase family protein [Abditibacteriaceae bacterium]